MLCLFLKESNDSIPHLIYNKRYYKIKRARMSYSESDKYKRKELYGKTEVDKKPNL